MNKYTLFFESTSYANVDLKLQTLDLVITLWKDHKQEELFKILDDYEAGRIDIIDASIVPDNKQDELQKRDGKNSGEKIAPDIFEQSNKIDDNVDGESRAKVSEKRKRKRSLSCENFTFESGENT